MKHRVAVLLCALAAALPTLPALASGPDARTQRLIQELGLEEAERPIRDWPRWRKPRRIHVAVNDLGGPWQQRLASAREVAGGVELVPVTEPLDPAILEDVEVLLGNCTPEVVRHATNLRWLQHPRHGVERCVAELRGAAFVLTNAQHTLAPQMAEHVVAMMLTMTRGLLHMHRAQLERRWIRSRIDFPMAEVGGKTLLIAGLGGIGTEVARRAHGLGMRVLATRNSSREGPEFVEYVGLAHELHELAGQADVIVNALPLTGDTRGLFDRAFFDAVKPGAWYITVGRGESTVTPDLVAALKDGRLAGAGMDVFDPEPLPKEHELWSLPNVLVSPHVSGFSDADTDRRWLLMRENLRRYVNGEPLLNVVDPERGY